MNPDERGCGEELWGIEGTEILFRIHCMKASIFNKKYCFPHFLIVCDLSRILSDVPVPFLLLVSSTVFCLTKNLSGFLTFFPPKEWCFSSLTCLCYLFPSDCIDFKLISLSLLFWEWGNSLLMWNFCCHVMLLILTIRTLKSALSDAQFTYFDFTEVGW